MPRPYEAEPAAPAGPAPRRVGGLLAAYVVAHGILIVHGLGLALAAVIVNANPALGGLSEPAPWGSIIFYVVSNVFLAAYSVVVMRLILNKRKSAVVNNAVWAISTVVFLLIWYFLGMKSPLGVVIDSLPGLVGMAYLARSRRVKETLVLS
ncbi:hypothetical protein AB0K12_36985 [Nonomuraea sp. NPDC049419]|uniref:hypothetical protein n=1 Tax=Nonomuraea sp. NPDC049419 TaxID=3155772 RepID=UPI003413DF99